VVRLGVHLVADALAAARHAKVVGATVPTGLAAPAADGGDAEVGRAGDVAVAVVDHRLFGLHPLARVGAFFDRGARRGRADVPHGRIEVGEVAAAGAVGDGAVLPGVLDRDEL